MSNFPVSPDYKYPLTLEFPDFPIILNKIIHERTTAETYIEEWWTYTIRFIFILWAISNLATMEVLWRSDTHWEDIDPITDQDIIDWIRVYFIKQVGAEWYASFESEIQQAKKDNQSDNQSSGEVGGGIF